MKTLKVRYGLLAVMLLAVMQPGVAQTISAPVAKTSTQGTSQLRESEPPAAQSKGIEVHGHWTIVIRNPDGSVSSRREFENSLVAAGQTFLSWFLAGQNGQFSWVVQVGSLCGKTTATPCALSEAALANDSTAVGFFKEGLMPVLTVSAPTTGTNAGTFVLTGSTSATFSGQIVTVGTEAFIKGNGLYGFTSTNLSQPISVQVGQVMDVTVMISFS